MKRTLLALIFLATPAFAQQPPSVNERAISAKLMAEINAGLSCSASLISTQDELTKAQARIKELEDKYEPKKEPGK